MVRTVPDYDPLTIFIIGGGFQLMILARMLQRRLQDAKVEPKSQRIPMAFVIDSAPGANEYLSMLSTFTTSVQSTLLKGVMLPPLTFIYAVYFIVNKVLGNEPLFRLLHSYLERPDLLPFANKDSPRLYVYSDRDQMVPYEAVEKHIAAVNRKGYAVRVEKFRGSPHVSHMRNNAERYWNAVRATWIETVAPYPCAVGYKSKL